MMIHEITPKAGAYKKSRRVGRGPGSGRGKTAGRGTKGAKSRSGYKRQRRASYQGGATQFFRRFQKRGFSNARFETVYAVVNLKAIEARFDNGAEVNPEMLVKVGLIHDLSLPVKVLGDGDLSKKLQVTAAAFSKTAADKIAKAGGVANVAK